jgi:hypothetical protein
MAATQTVASFGRIAVFGNLSAVLVTINGNGASYATASGGLPIDLTAVLNQASPFSAPINPTDVVAFVPIGLSANGYLPGGFVAGSPTYTTGSGATVRAPQTLATFPATVRLNGIGAAATNHAALGEVADGANSDSFTALLLIARGGTNVN